MPHNGCLLTRAHFNCVVYTLSARHKARPLHLVHAQGGIQKKLKSNCIMAHADALSFKQRQALKDQNSSALLARKLSQGSKALASNLQGLPLFETQYLSMSHPWVGLRI